MPSARSHIEDQVWIVEALYREYDATYAQPVLEEYANQALQRRGLVLEEVESLDRVSSLQTAEAKVSNLSIFLVEDEALIRMMTA
jgi:hypothetical protein